MALNPKRSTAAVNLEANAIAGSGSYLNSGKINIYSGTQPVDANTTKGAAVLLAALTLNATAFGAAVAGVATANAITSDTNAPATGTATWFRVNTSGNTDVTNTAFDGSVGTSGADLNLNTTSIVAAATVAITSFTYTASKG